MILLSNARNNNKFPKCSKNRKLSKSTPTTPHSYPHMGVLWYDPPSRLKYDTPIPSEI